MTFLNVSNGCPLSLLQGNARIHQTKSLGSLSNDDIDDNEIGKKRQQAFCTFLCRHCTTTTWKCLISRLVVDKNSRQRLSLSFPELRYSLLECQYQYLTNWTTWNKRDKVWSLRRRCCLSSLIRIKTPSPECLSCIAGFWNGIPCLRKFVLIS